MKRVGKRSREGLSIRQLGVLLEDELRFISHLLINLKADDLIMEDARCDALAWITRVQQDIASARQDRPRSSVSQGAQGSQVEVAWRGHPPALSFEGKWLVDALVAGTVKSVGSSFGIGLGASPPVPMLMVLISWPTSEVSLAQRIWAQLSLDSWVRLAGCSRWEAPANPYLAGAIGFRIDAWNEDPLDVDNNPFAQPDED